MSAPDPLRIRLAVALGTRFTLERELTGGGMARVFVAHEVALNRRVVLKTLAPELAASLSAERFDREIQLVAALQHPNIVGVHASGSVDGVPWFSMPFVEGDSLRARLAKGPMSEGEAVGILRDVARALAYAHDRGVVHRDIKPDNILLADDAAVVTDFGIAKAVTAARTASEQAPNTSGPITSAGISLGTPAYMAPEQAAADANVDRRADLYALGCVAYELVAGRAPFTGGSAAELLRAHLTTPAPAIPAAAGVSNGYARLVARCLAKDPGQRPATAREVLRALEQLGGAGESAAASGGLLPALAVWAATLAATYVLARAAVVGIGLPDVTVAWATGAAALGLPVVLATWWVKRAARRAELATPTWTPGGTLSQTTLAGIALKASPYATWRRARRLPWLAVGAVAVTVAVLLGLRAAGAGPWKPVTKPGRLLVADFSVPDSDEGLSESLTQALRTALDGSTTLQVMSQEEIGAVLQRMARDPKTRLTAPVALEVAQRQGVPLVLTGRVSKLGSGFVVSVSLEEPGSKTAVFTRQRAANTPEDLLSSIDWLARRLREEAGDSYADVKATQPLAEVTTASMDALRAYSRGLRLADREGRYDEAMSAFEEAVRIDSTFASAWRSLAMLAWVNGRPGSQVLHFTRQAHRYRDRGSPAEREEIERVYLARTNTREAANAFLRTGRANVVHSTVLRVFRDLGRYAQAESLAMARLRADSTSGTDSPYTVLVNLLYTQVARERLADAQATHAQLQRLAPAGTFTRASVVTLMWRTGGVDSLEAFATRLASATDPEQRESYARLRAKLTGMRGQLWRYLDASRAYEEEPRNTVRQVSKEQPLLDAVTTVAILRDRPAWGVVQLDSLRRADPQRDRPMMDRRHPELAIAYARLGRPSVARELLATFLEALQPEERLYAWGRWRLAEAEIALAERRPEDAITAFRRAGGADSGQVEVAMYRRVEAGLARAFDAAGRTDSAAHYLARLTEGNLPVEAPLVLPLAYRRLGELAEERGDLAEALRRYRAFVELWRNADPELQPQVADIRRRIAALEAREARRR